MKSHPTRTRLFGIFAGLLILQVSVLGAPDPAKQADKRAKIADDILKGARKADSALGELKSTPAASGLEIDTDADYALAAIDVGHRLLVKGNGADAMVFFKAAETALSSLTAKTPDTNPGIKVMYLKQLAMIRGNYLNKIDQAKVDIDQAAALLPNDEHVKHVRLQLASEHGNVFKDGPTPKG